VRAIPEEIDIGGGIRIASNKNRVFYNTAIGERHIGGDGFVIWGDANSLTDNVAIDSEGGFHWTVTSWLRHHGHGARLSNGKRPDAHAVFLNRDDGTLYERFLKLWKEPIEQAVDVFGRFVVQPEHDQ